MSYADLHELETATLRLALELLDLAERVGELHDLIAELATSAYADQQDRLLEGAV